MNPLDCFLAMSWVKDLTLADPDRAIPVRVDGPHVVLTTSANTNAALLWLEFMAGAQGQAIIDEYEPVSASVFSPGSVIEKIVKGKKAWIRDLQSIDKTQKWMAMAVEAFGFPRGKLPDTP